MRLFTTTELSRMQGTQTAAMQDTVILESYTGGAGTSPYGYGYSHSYADSVAVAAGLDMAPSREVMEAGQVALPDARLRLSLATAGYVANVNRVRVTHRYGVLLSTPLVYDVIGLPERGPSGLQLNLRLATAGETSTPLPVDTYSFDLSDADNSFYVAVL